MLVLNRRPGEAVIIGGDVRVVVLSSDRKGVRLGIAAPAATTILREELVQEVMTQNRRAAEADPADWATRIPLRSDQDGVGA